MVVVVDNGVVIVDVGCAGIITGDVATLGRLGVLVMKAVGSVSVWAAGSVGFVLV